MIYGCMMCRDMVEAMNARYYAHKIPTEGSVRIPEMFYNLILALKYCSWRKQGQNLVSFENMMLCGLLIDGGGRRCHYKRNTHTKKKKIVEDNYERKADLVSKVGNWLKI